MTLVSFCFGIFKDLLGHQVTAQDISHHGKLQRLVEYFCYAGIAGAVDALFDITGSGPAGIDYYGDVASVPVRLETRGHFVAIQSRQVDVQRNKIRPSARRFIDDFMAQAFYKRSKSAAEGLIAIDIQYIFCWCAAC
jgi:hypothetical protein